MDNIQIRLTEEQLGKILEDGREEIIAAAVRSVKDRIQWSAKEIIADTVKPVVEKFVLEEIVPELTEHLIGQKSAILTNIVAQADEIGAMFVKALVTQVGKTLGEPYKRRALFEALFK